MENKFISLLYPNERSMEYHQDRRNLPEISEEVCDELGLNEIFGLRNSSLTDFFTMDTEVIEYRQQTIRDMMNIPEIKKTLAEVHPILDDIRQLRILDNEDANVGDSYLYSITEIELYVSCIDTLKEGFVPVRDKIKSRAFGEMCDFIVELSESDYYIELTKKLEDLSSRVREVRSVTIGVNLDRQLRPESAGVISIHSEQFKSGKMLDKILRMSFKNDAFTSIAELTPVKKGQSENRKEALMAAFNNAIDEVFKGSVKGWRNIVGGYVLDNTDFLLKLLPEIEFVSRATDLMNRLSEHPGCNVCMPTVCPIGDKVFEAHRRFIDIHYCIKGTEGIGYADVDTLEPTTEYNEADDYLLLKGSYQKIILREGDFMIVYPEDAHIPMMAGDSEGELLKAVAKIEL